MITHADIDRRLIAQLERFGTDAYNVGNHPLLRVMQNTRPRCPSDCGCFGCRVWRAVADGILQYLENEQ